MGRMRAHLADLRTLSLNHGRDDRVDEVGVEVIRDRDDIRARLVTAVGDALTADGRDVAVGAIQRRQQFIGCKVEHHTSASRL